MTRIGKYEIQAELGRGGFGRVYRAYDPTVGRLVAIKVLTSEGDTGMLARFRNEAAATGNLRHKNIVTIYEFGEHEGSPFLAMEFLEGEDLQHILASGKPLTLLEKMRIMSQVADGLECAHHRGVIHRDVKPANLMVQPDGTVKIMDFGIARVIGSNSTRLTQKGYLIGTVLYMAPEQFGGADTDAQSDIFAYGVIYYELLTGRHPFQAQDFASLMFRITSEEPPAVCSIVPDCPAGLEQIVQRAMNKEREFRYQSLEDLQVDARPLLLDLERQQAARLVTEARQCFDAGNLEGAQGKLREGLELDPANTAGRQLRDAIQQQLQRRAVRPRIQMLLKTAGEHLDKRGFTQAIQVLESAQRLDRTNPEIQARMELARSLHEQNKIASRFLAEARKELQQQNLSGAYKIASEAVRIDPHHPEGAELLDRIGREIERREQERRLQEGLSGARNLLLLGDLDRALTQLAELDVLHPGSEAVSELLQRARQKKSERERRSRLAAQVGEVRQLLKDSRFEDAQARLETLASEYAENAEVADLLAYTREEIAGHRKANAVRRACLECRSLAEAGEFDRALQLLDENLRAYPGAPELVELLQITLDAKAWHQRQQAIQTVLRRSAELEREQRLAESVQLLEEALREHGNDPALSSEHERLLDAWRRQVRFDSLRQVAEEARGFLERGRPNSAVRLLRQAISQHGAETELAPLLGEAEERLCQLERAQTVQKLEVDIRRLAELRDYSGALEILEQGLRSYPDEAAIQQMIESVRVQQSGYERRQKLEDAGRRAQELRAEERYPEAIDALQGALRQYPGDAGLIRLRDEIEAALAERKRRDAALAGTQSARTLLDQGRPNEAVRLLEGLVAQYPGAAELASLLEIARNAGAAQQTLAESTGLEQGGNLAAALQAVELGLGRHPENAGLRAARERLQARISEEQRGHRISDLLRQIEQGTSRHDWSQTAQLIRVGQRDFPDEPRLARLAAVEAAAGEIEAALGRGDLEAASACVSQALVAHPAERRFEWLRGEVERLQRARAADAAAELAKRPPAPIAAIPFWRRPVWIAAGAVLALGLCVALVLVLTRTPAKQTAAVGERMAPAAAAAPPVTPRKTPEVPAAEPILEAPEPMVPPVKKQAPPVRAAKPQPAEPSPPAAVKPSGQQRESAPPTPTIPAESTPAAAIPQPAPATAEPYYGPPSIALTWTGSLPPGATLRIRGRDVSAGALSGGRLPIIAAGVSVRPAEIQVVQQPSPDNNFTLLLRNTGDQALNSIRIEWTRR